MVLRPYQTKLIDDIKQAFKTGKHSVCAVLSCGGGKSVIAGMIAKSATDKGNRVMFIVHRKELCEQIRQTFAGCGVDMNLCMVGMVQTVTRRLEKINEPDLIICDEAHHCLSNTYRNIFNYFSDALLIGFTATPIRLNDGGLGDVMDELIESVSTKWLIENHYLSPYKYYSVQVADTSKVKVVRGEYDIKQLAELMEDKYIYGETIRNYQKIADGKKTIVYCVSVESSKQTAKEFRENDYIAESLDGSTPKAERERIMQDFRDNKITVLCNCELFGEGLDVPDVECVILLRKTKSLTLYIQQSMRAMRYKPDKTAIIIDHVRNVFEHDFPDADREWELWTRKKRKGKSEVCVKECPECYAVVPTPVRICPQCEYEFKPQERSEKEMIEAELEEITEVFKSKPYMYYKRLKTWGELEAFRKAKGYKFMWSVHKALECNIEIPDKYDNLVRRVRNQRTRFTEHDTAGAI